MTRLPIPHRTMLKTPTVQDMLLLEQNILDLQNGDPCVVCGHVCCWCDGTWSDAAMLLQMEKELKEVREDLGLPTPK